MSIAIVVPYGLEESGIILAMTRLANELNKRGITTNLFLRCNGGVISKNTDDVINFSSIQDVTFQLFKNGSMYDVVFWAGFCQNSNEIAVQIESSIQFRKQPGKRVFFMWERTGEIDVVPQSDLFYLLLNNASDGILALNQSQVALLKQQGFPDARIHLMPPGIDTQDIFKPLESDDERSMIKRKLGWVRESPIVLTIGRLVMRKRIDLVARLWREETSLSNAATLAIVGAMFGVEPYLEKLIQDMAETTNGIRFHPYSSHSDIPQYYQAANIFVIPGILEGEPSVLSEAMACGLAVVASNIPGHTGLIHHGMTGLLFEPDNRTDLLDNIFRLINAPHLCGELGRAARKEVVAKRDIGVIADEFISFIRSQC